MDEENVKMQKIVRLHVDMAYFLLFFVLVMHSQKIISIFLFLFFIKKKIFHQKHLARNLPKRIHGKTCHIKNVFRHFLWLLNIKDSQTFKPLVTELTQNQETHCLPLQWSTSWGLHLNCNPDFLPWMLVSKPLYQRSLWGRTSRELRGGDLEDLFLQAHAFFSHFQLLLFSLCDTPAGAVAPADQPVSPLTAW